MGVLKTAYALAKDDIDSSNNNTLSTKENNILFGRVVATIAAAVITASLAAYNLTDRTEENAKIDNLVIVPSDAGWNFRKAANGENLSISEAAHLNENDQLAHFVEQLLAHDSENNRVEINPDVVQKVAENLNGRKIDNTQVQNSSALVTFLLTAIGLFAGAAQRRNDKLVAAAITPTYIHKALREQDNTPENPAV